MNRPAADLARPRPPFALERDSLLDLALALFAEWRLRARSRRELKLLSEHDLKDIGLSSTQAAYESDKSFLER